MPQTFRDLIAANKRNSVLLVLCFCLFTVAVVLILAIAAMAYLDPRAIEEVRWQEVLLLGGAAGGISLLISWIGYLAGDSLILAVSGARPLDVEDDPELFHVVEEMAIAAGIPMPRVYLIHDAAPNAFATGRDPQHAAVAITTGLRAKLTRDELQGVMAHEVSHIRNYDIRLMLLLAVLVGTVAMLSDVFVRMLWYTSPGRSSRGSSKDKEDGGGNVLALVLFVVGILCAILAPLVAHLIQLAVSREREYLADASAVELTRYPQGLANALRKLDADPAELQAANRGTAHLWVVNPIKKYREWADSMFASHPPARDRIQRLESLIHK